MEAQYTRGSIPAMMLKTAGAMLASTLSMSGYNIADTYFVGQLGGSEPLAAMGFTFPIIMLAGCLFGGFGGGCMALMAQALGARKEEEARLTVSSGMLLVALIAVVVTAVGLLFAPPLYAALGAQGETLRQLEGYMTIWFLGCVTAAIAMPGNHLLIAAGKPVVSSLMTILGLVINVVLDPIFIFGGEGVARFAEGLPVLLGAPLEGLAHCLAFLPAMGIRGAALATVLSQAVSAFLLLALLRHLRLLSFRPIPPRTLLRSWGRLAGYAIPSILGMLLVPVTNAITTRVTASFGNVMVAATATASRLESVVFVIPMAFGIPLMSIIAQNYGAKLYGRVRYAFRFASLFAFSVLLAAAVLLVFVIPYVAALFTPEADVQAIVVEYMHIIPWGFGLLELTRYAGFALTGTGHPKRDAILKAVRLLLLLIPLSLLAGYLHWRQGVFYARLVADLVGGGLTWGCAAWVLHKLPKADGQDADSLAA